MIRPLIALCSCAIASSALAEEDPEAGWARPGYERVKNRLVVRPLTIPRRTFDVYVTPSLGTPSKTEQSFLRLPMEERGTDPLFALSAGALFGLGDDLEVGLLFPPILFKNGIVLGGPMAQITWRALVVGGFELGLTGASILPVAQTFSIEGRVPMLLRLGDSARLDFVPSISAQLGGGTEYALLKIPVTLTAQLADRVFARANVGISSLGFETLAMIAGVEVGTTIAGDYGAFADLSLGLSFPTLVDGGAATHVNADHWLVTLSGHFFFKLPQDRNDPGGDL